MNIGHLSEFDVLFMGAYKWGTEKMAMEIMAMEKNGNGNNGNMQNMEEMAKLFYFIKLINY